MASNNFWDQFKDRPVDQPLSPEPAGDFWSKFAEKPREEDSVGKKAARTAKSLVSGAGGGLVDTAAALYNIPAALTNAQKATFQDIDPQILAFGEAMGGMPAPIPGQTDLPLIPSAVDALDKKVDEVTGGYTTTPEDEKALHEGLKMIGSVGGTGGLGALAGKIGWKGIEQILKVFGSTRPTTMAAAGAAGAATEKAHETGMSQPASLSAGLGAAVGTELAAAALNPKNLAKGAVKAAGFGKNNFKLDALDSAKRLETDLPNAAATSGVLPQFAHQLIAKTPWIGDKLKKDVQTASIQYQKAWDKMLDSVGSPKTPELTKEIAQDYKLMKAAIPQDAAVMPTPILNAIAEVEKELQSTFHAEPTKKLFAVMQDIKQSLLPTQGKLPDGFEKYPKHVQEKILEALQQHTTPQPISLRELLRQKVELNKLMRDKNIFDRTDTDTLSFIKRIQKATNQTLEEYGKNQNPKFLKRLKAADEKFAKTARREELDDLLAGKIRDPNTGEVAYTPLVKILQDRDHQVFLKNNLGDQNYKKLTDFINVAQAMDALKRNNPNPSGTALVTAVIGFVQGLAGSNPLPTLTSGLGAYGATKLLTSKRFLNKATQFAKEPTEPLARQLQKMVKEETGVTLQTLLKNREEKQP